MDGAEGECPTCIGSEPGSTKLGLVGGATRSEVSDAVASVATPGGSATVGNGSDAEAGASYNCRFVVA